MGETLVATEITGKKMNPVTEPKQGEIIRSRGLLIEENILEERELLNPLISVAKSARFNFIFFPAFYRGLTLYESSVAHKYKIPSISPHFSSPPLIEELLRPASTGMFLGMISPLFFFENYKRSRASRKLLSNFRHWAMRTHNDKLISIENATEENSYRWLCPANDEYRNFIVELLTELVDSVPLSALIVDVRPLMELPEICFCKYCRRKIEEIGGENIRLHWDDLSEKDSIRLLWLKWIHVQIMQFFGYLKSRILSQRPDLLLMLLVPDRGVLPASLERPLPWLYMWHYLFFDELLISEDLTNPEECTEQVKRNLKRMPDTSLLQPVITSTTTSNLGAMISSCQKLPLTGFILRYNRHILLSDLEDIGKTYFKEAAFPGEISPVQACKLLASNIEERLEGPQELKTFFTDLLRMMDKMPYANLAKFFHSVLTNLRVFEDKIDRDVIEVVGREPDNLINDIYRLRRLLGFFIEKNR